MLYYANVFTAESAHLPAAEQLHDDVGVLLVEDNLLDADNVRVLQLSQDGNLRLQGLQVLVVRQRLVLDHLGGVLHLLHEVHGVLHHGEPATASTQKESGKARTSGQAARHTVLEPETGRKCRPRCCATVPSLSSSSCGCCCCEAAN